MNLTTLRARKALCFSCRRRYREVKRQWVYPKFSSRSDQKKLLSSARRFFAFCGSVVLLTFYRSRDIYGMMILCFYSMGVFQDLDFTMLLYTEPIVIFWNAIERVPFLLQTWHQPFLFFMIPFMCFILRGYSFVSINPEVPLPVIVVQTSVVCLMNVIGKYMGGLQLYQAGLVLLGSITGTILSILYECYRRNRIANEKTIQELMIWLKIIDKDTEIRNRQYIESELERSRLIRQSEIRIAEIWERRRLRLLNTGRTDN